MKSSQIFLSIVSALIYLMLGCFLFFMVCFGLSNVVDVSKDIQRLYEHRIISGLFGIFFLSCGYAVIKFLIKRTYKDELFVVETKFGRTSVALVAIQDLMRKVFRKYDAIKRHKMSVRVQNKILTVNVNLTLFMDAEASNVISNLQNELTLKLSRIIGLPKESLEINVRVDKVVENKIRKNIDTHKDSID